MFTWIFEHIGLDKLKHLACSFVIAAIGGILTLLFEATLPAALFAAIYTGLVAAVTKEYTDWAWGGEFGVADLGFDAIGIVLGTLTTLLITIG